ncbi:MAG: hypothetical protein QOD55_672 [Solirubrobacteraceae bacterium]|nr:hypothetical protein [Solirubrobacteraceae bacterium]
MTRRRILLFVLLLLVVAAFADAVAPRDQQLAVKPPEGTTAPAPPADVAEATFPKDRRLRARVGDVVQVEVRNEQADEVQIVALGISEPVERDLPAELVFDADRPGRFAVTLRDGARRVGTIEIRAAG